LKGWKVLKVYLEKNSKKNLILAQKIQKLAQKASNWHKIRISLKLKEFQTISGRFGHFWAKLKGWKVLKVAQGFGKKFQKNLILAQKIQKLAQKASNWHKIRIRPFWAHFWQFWAHLGNSGPN
jgi:hypothetical protein